MKVTLCTGRGWRVVTSRSVNRSSLLRLAGVLFDPSGVLSSVGVAVAVPSPRPPDGARELSYRLLGLCHQPDSSSSLPSVRSRTASGDVASPFRSRPFAGFPFVALLDDGRRSHRRGFIRCHQAAPGSRTCRRCCLHRRHIADLVAGAILAQLSARTMTARSGAPDPFWSLAGGAYASRAGVDYRRVACSCVHELPIS